MKKEKRVSFYLRRERNTSRYGDTYRHVDSRKARENLKNKVGREIGLPIEVKTSAMDFRR